MKTKMMIAALLTISATVMADDIVIKSVDDIVKIEQSNGAKFKKYLVGKTVTIPGIVKTVNTSFFNIEAKGTFGGMPVYYDNVDFLADLDTGRKVIITCEIQDMPLIGSALGKCTSVNLVKK